MYRSGCLVNALLVYQILCCYGRHPDATTSCAYNCKMQNRMVGYSLYANAERVQYKRVLKLYKLS